MNDKAILLDCIFPHSVLQQEVENFKKVHLISREEFDCLTSEPPVDPNQEVPPGPPRPQQSKLLPHSPRQESLLQRQAIVISDQIDFGRI
ncbi:hypothetical protein AAFF_G00161260 [Aldrovandia affinis]|uniref:Uncharacterized protein n=1 Tax=Aldrovandia affinis TaxID=143900 RepID=A0AAD7R0M9_9TELE|nr:hypothetical protein AAFF_G00161260 [Aldrovandia affinis]